MSLSNNDYQDIMRQYEERRLSNYRLHEQRKKDIYTTIPEIKELDRQITANSISLGKQLIIRDDPALREEYRIKNQVLISQKQALLKEAGYSGHRIYWAGTMFLLSSGDDRSPVFRF